MLACQGFSAEKIDSSTHNFVHRGQYQIHIDVMDVARLENKGASPSRRRQQALCKS
jgi:hypothetical protein